LQGRDLDQTNKATFREAVPNEEEPFMSKRRAKYPPRSDRNVPKRHDGAGDLKNKILLALPPNEYALLSPKLTLINLQLHDVLQEPGQQIKFASFPNTAMSSVLNLMADGKCVEVGLVGTEGMVGMPLIANLNSSPNLTVIQAPGTLFRIKAQEFKAILPDCPQLNRELVHYAQVVALEIMQIAACNRLHEFHERLARWLLMSEDRISSHAAIDRGISGADAWNSPRQRICRF
jgi:CRP-like cAMP-binding protein